VRLSFTEQTNLLSPYPSRAELNGDDDGGRDDDDDDDDDHHHHHHCYNVQLILLVFF
jgi:hypothetical protein